MKGSGRFEAPWLGKIWNGVGNFTLRRVDGLWDIDTRRCSALEERAYSPAERLKPRVRECTRDLSFVLITGNTG